MVQRARDRQRRRDQAAAHWRTGMCPSGAGPQQPDPLMRPIRSLDRAQGPLAWSPSAARVRRRGLGRDACCFVLNVAILDVQFSSAGLNRHRSPPRMPWLACLVAEMRTQEALLSDPCQARTDPTNRPTDQSTERHLFFVRGTLLFKALVAAWERYGLKVGASVDARFGGQGEWYRAFVSEVHSDGTVDLLYVLVASSIARAPSPSVAERRRFAPSRGPRRRRFGPCSRCTSDAFVAGTRTVTSRRRSHPRPGGCGHCDAVPAPQSMSSTVRV